MKQFMVKFYWMDNNDETYASICNAENAEKAMDQIEEIYSDICILSVEPL